MKFFAGLLIFLAFSANAYAAEIAQTGSPARKLQRGFLNVALSPFELSRQFANEKKNDTLPPSWMLALGRGTCYMVGRAVVGAGEMVTFFIPAPANYGPVLQPEFPWELSPELKETK